MPFLFICLFSCFPFSLFFSKVNASRHIIFLEQSLLSELATLASSKHHLGDLTAGGWLRKLLFLMGCVLDVFNYFFPHINVNRSTVMRSGSHLHNLQVSLPHLRNTFLTLQNIVLFIATEIKMNSLMSFIFHFISSISK